MESTLSPDAEALLEVADSVHQKVVGQEHAVEGLLVALLTGGHVLLEGLPGLAKTLMVRTLADAIHTTFRRIQFTPDLLPGDITGTPVYRQATGEFEIQKGPVFANIVLADEVNRAPPKVQSALLEAMEEEQVTIAGETFQLEQPFLVLATQNPVELHGTYPLAEAQLDRFMMKIVIEYPDRNDEREIVRRMTGRPPEIESSTSVDAIFRARETVDQIRVDDRVLDYVLDLVFATRRPGEADLGTLEDLIEYGTSPRATLFLVRAARAHAFLRGRDFVLPDDVKAMVLPVFRHRIRTTYEADARGVTPDDVVRTIVDTVHAP